MWSTALFYALVVNLCLGECKFFLWILSECLFSGEAGCSEGDLARVSLRGGEVSFWVILKGSLLCLII